MGKRPKFSGRTDYFAVNAKPAGLTTNYRVSGRLGEMAKRFSIFDEAIADCKRINRAYELGYKHGQDAATPIKKGEKA